MTCTPTPGIEAGEPMETMMYATEQGILNGQWNAAEAAFQAEIARATPHVLMRPRIYPDGDQWCALYGEDIQSGVAGFGLTPAEACADFDRNWAGQRLKARAAASIKSEIDGIRQDLASLGEVDAEDDLVWSEGQVVLAPVRIKIIDHMNKKNCVLELINKDYTVADLLPA